MSAARPLSRDCLVTLQHIGHTISESVFRSSAHSSIVSMAHIKISGVDNIIQIIRPITSNMMTHSRYDASLLEYYTDLLPKMCPPVSRAVHVWVDPKFNGLLESRFR